VNTLHRETSDGIGYRERVVTGPAGEITVRQSTHFPFEVSVTRRPAPEPLDMAGLMSNRLRFELDLFSERLTDEAWDEIEALYRTHLEGAHA